LINGENRDKIMEFLNNGENGDKKIEDTILVNNEVNSDKIVS
jgi:hypothetical protein